MPGHFITVYVNDTFGISGSTSPFSSSVKSGKDDGTLFAKRGKWSFKPAVTKYFHSLFPIFSIGTDIIIRQILAGVRFWFGGKGLGWPGYLARNIRGRHRTILNRE